MVRRSGAVAALLVVAAGVACSGGDDDPQTARSGGEGTEAGGSGNERSTTTAPAHDPPLGFAEEGVHLGTVRDGDYEVVDGAAYFVETVEATGGAEDALVAADLATGEPIWSLPIDDTFLGVWGAPAVAEVGDRTLVFATYGAVAEGTGTEADQEMLRIVAFDAANAADAEPVWATDIPATDIPEEAREEVLGTSATDITPAGVMAADTDHVVVSTDEGYRGAFTLVLDAADGALRWAAPGFQAVALGGGVVAGLVEPGEVPVDFGQLAARAVADGAPVWQGPTDFVPDDRTIRALGPERLSAGGDVFAEDSFADSDATHVFDLRRGTAMATFDGVHTCVADGEATIVCDSGEHVVALDSASGETTWQLPDEAAGRIAPRVTAARSGAVYGETDDGAVILDARTGEDRVADAAIAPHTVAPGFGLVFEGQPGDDAALVAHPSTE